MLVALLFSCNVTPIACMPALQEVSFISCKELLGNQPRPLNEQMGNAALVMRLPHGTSCLALQHNLQ